MKPLTEAQRELYDWIVKYICEHKRSPSIRQMMRAMNLKSPAPVQSRLEHLRDKGYIEWTKGGRKILAVSPPTFGIPIRGEISATSFVENYPYLELEVEYLNLSDLLKPGHFGLKVYGHSMIEALIDDGDIVVIQSGVKQENVRNDTVVVAQHQGKTMLKYFEREGNKVILKSGNPNRELYPIIEVPINDLEIQGILVGVWRDYRQSSSQFDLAGPNSSGKSPIATPNSRHNALI